MRKFKHARQRETRYSRWWKAHIYKTNGGVCVAGTWHLVGRGWGAECLEQGTLRPGKPVLSALPKVIKWQLVYGSVSDVHIRALPSPWTMACICIYIMNNQAQFQVLKRAESDCYILWIQGKEETDRL